MQNTNTLRKIGTLKIGQHFEMAGRQYIITRSGIGYMDVEFKSSIGSKEILTTIHKNNKVEVIENKPEKSDLTT